MISKAHTCNLSLLFLQHRRRMLRHCICCHDGWIAGALMHSFWERLFALSYLHRIFSTFFLGDFGGKWEKKVDTCMVGTGCVNFHSSMTEWHTLCRCSCFNCDLDAPTKMIKYGSIQLLHFKMLFKHLPAKDGHLSPRGLSSSSHEHLNSPAHLRERETIPLIVQCKRIF